MQTTRGVSPMQGVDMSAAADKLNLNEGQREILEQDLEALMPKPVGFKMLISLPEISEKTDGGIIKPAEIRNREQVGSVVGRVIDMGAECYADKKRFSSPWCEIGDWVMMRSYSGTRFTLNGREFRLLNDDSIEAVVDDPKGIAKL